METLTLDEPELVILRLASAVIMAYDITEAAKRMAPGFAGAVQHEISQINDFLDDDDVRTTLEHFEAQGLIPLRRDGVRYSK